MNGMARNRVEVLHVQQDLLPVMNLLAALEFDLLPTAEEKLLREAHMRLAAASATLEVIADRLDTIRERRAALRRTEGGTVQQELSDALAADVSMLPEYVPPHQSEGVAS